MQTEHLFQSTTQDVSTQSTAMAMGIIILKTIMKCK